MKTLPFLMLIIYNYYSLYLPSAKASRSIRNDVDILLQTDCTVTVNEKCSVAHHIIRLTQQISVPFQNITVHFTIKILNLKKIILHHKHSDFGKIVTAYIIIYLTDESF